LVIAGLVVTAAASGRRQSAKPQAFHIPVAQHDPDLTSGKVVTAAASGPPQSEKPQAFHIPVAQHDPDLTSSNVVTAAASGPLQSEKPQAFHIPATQQDPDLAPSNKDAFSAQQLYRAESLLNEIRDAGPHQVLGVSDTASKAEIKAAYHRLAKEFHPDRFFSENSGVEPPKGVRELFEKIRNAYDSLKDDDVRNESSGKQQTDKSTDPSPEVLEKAARASHNIGVQDYQQKDFFSAVQHFREAVRLQPESARYHHSLARALMRNPRWRREAEEQFLKAIELDEFNADYRVSLGMLYLDGGLPRKAEAQFRDALGWDAENRAAQRELAKLQSKAQSTSWFDKLLGKKKT
jgi:curved DNA-binding protein CbpA